MCTTTTFSNPLFPIPFPSGICVTQDPNKRLPGPAVDQSPTKVQTIFLTSFPKAKRKTKKKGKGKEKKTKYHPVRVPD